MPRTFTNLLDQVADFNELSQEMLEASDPIWAEHGFDAACVFLLGA